MRNFNDLAVRAFVARQLTKIPRTSQSMLLDLGCGTRPYADLYQHRFRFCVGADREARGAIHIHVDAARLPFSESSFDLVLLSEVIEHLSEPKAALMEVERVLKPGGILLLTWPLHYMVHEIPHDYVRLTEFGVANMLRATSMRIEHLERRGNAFVVLTALLEFLLLGFLELLGRTPAIGGVFRAMKWLLRYAFHWTYRLLLRLASSEIPDWLGWYGKAAERHLALWTLGYCAVIRKDHE